VVGRRWDPASRYVLFVGINCNDRARKRASDIGAFLEGAYQNIGPLVIGVNSNFLIPVDLNRLLG
jgi:hypothetical protein